MSINLTIFNKIQTLKGWKKRFVSLSKWISWPDLTQFCSQIPNQYQIFMYIFFFTCPSLMDRSLFNSFLFVSYPACSWWYPDIWLESCCWWSTRWQRRTCPCPTYGWADPWCKQIYPFRKLRPEERASHFRQIGSSGGSTWTCPQWGWSKI